MKCSVNFHFKVGNYSVQERRGAMEVRKKSVFSVRKVVPKVWSADPKILSQVPRNP